MKLTRGNVLWFAGLFEGEGFFRFCPKGRRSMGIRIKMTDRDVLEKAQSAFGGGIWDRQKILKPQHRQSYTWMLDARDQAYALLVAIYPFLGLRRQGQVEKWIEQYKQLTPKPPTPVLHGTTTGYCWYSCRCDACRTAQHTYYVTRRQRLATQP